MNAKPLYIRHLTFRWPGQGYLFDDLNLDFPDSCVTAIMGNNGTGKTTLLELIACRLSPSSGKIVIGGDSAKPLQFNYNPQRSERLLFPHLTIEENISLQHPNHRTSNLFQIDSLFPNLSVLQTYPAQCSGGQRQRAVLARALLDVPNFPVTLLDESFSQLSDDAKAAVGPLLVPLARESSSVLVFVSHDLCDAMCFADQVLVLGSGSPRSFNTSSIGSKADFWSRAELRDEVQRALAGNPKEALS